MHHYTKYLLTLLLLLGLLSTPLFTAPARAASTTGDGWPGDDVKISIHPCAMPLAFGEHDGETAVCGTITVPVDYAKPEGKHLEIAFVKLLSTSLSPAAEPVVYLEGGPGGSSLEAVEGLADLFATLRQTNDVILFDQRGALFSTPLSCTPVLQTLEVSKDTDPEMADIYNQLTAADADAPAPTAFLSWLYGTCAQIYGDEGYDLTQFNSRNNARDLMNLVHALGYDAANLYGISYGTRLALTAMRDWPAHIRSVVLDSSYPPQVKGYEETTLAHEEQFKNIFAACEADAACAEAYPDLAERLHAVLQQDLSVTDAEGNTETVAEYLSNLPGMINHQPALANWLPRIIVALEAGEIVDLAQLSESVDQPAEKLDLSKEDEIILTTQEALGELKQQGDDLLIEKFHTMPGYRFFMQLQEAADTLAPEEQAGLPIELWSMLALSSDPPRTALNDLIGEAFDKEAAAPLLGALEQLSDDDVRTVLDIVRIAGADDGMTDGMFNSFECNEEVPFNDLAAADAALDSQAFPELGQEGLTVNAQIETECKWWPKSTVDAAFREPVKSGIPTLVLSGLYDTQTPPSWNTLAAENLSNAYLMEFPMAGHGVIVFSKCAKDIGRAFINAPGVRPNDACIAHIAADFVAPDVELPLLSD